MIPFSFVFDLRVHCNLAENVLINVFFVQILFYSHWFPKFVCIFAELILNSFVCFYLDKHWCHGRPGHYWLRLRQLVNKYLYIDHFIQQSYFPLVICDSLSLFRKVKYGILYIVCRFAFIWTQLIFVLSQD